MMLSNAPMNTWPGSLPTGVTGGKSIDDAPVSRGPLGPIGVTGLAAVQLVCVLPWGVTKNGASDPGPAAPYRPGTVRDAATLANPLVTGDDGVGGVRSCEIGFQVSPPLPSSSLTNTWKFVWVRTLCPVVSVSTLA